MIFRSDSTVELIDKMGSDVKIAAAARNSVSMASAIKLFHENDEENKSVVGLIRSLMNKKHGTPFECCCMTLAIDTPIFVTREFQRHRIASYSEASARYRPLRAEFYIPPRERPLGKVLDFKPMAPEFKAIDEADYKTLVEEMQGAYTAQWTSYQYLMSQSIDPGLARAVVGVGVYTSFWVTWNLRSIMNFLSLRVRDIRSKEETFPLYEIHQVGLQVEAIFKAEFPLVHQFFCEVGRRAP